MRVLAFVLTFLVLASPLRANDATADALFDALGLPDMIDIMREEGIMHADVIGQDLIGPTPGTEWNALIDRIYDTDRMQAELRRTLDTELADADMDRMLAFFTAEPGKTIVALEVSARRAMLDDAIDAASKERAAIAQDDETPRFVLVRDLVLANDLIETNVTGALNANFAFYMGLIDGGAMPASVTEDAILSDVWAQEPQIRRSTREWLYAFLIMAYQPMSDDELATYIAFSKSDAGQDLNIALFKAFDGMLENISRGLGLASSRMMLAQEL